jgi:hypothetical protein
LANWYLTLWFWSTKIYLVKYLTLGTIESIKDLLFLAFFTLGWKCYLMSLWKIKLTNSFSGLILYMVEEISVEVYIENTSAIHRYTLHKFKHRTYYYQD